MVKSNHWKKRKSLGRHITSAVVFMIASLICATVAIAYSTKKIFDYSIRDRIKKVYTNSIYVTRMFEESASTEDDEKILDYLKNNPEFATAVHILDADKNIIAGFGEVTFDLTKENSFDIPTIRRLEKDLNIKLVNNFSVYADTSSDEVATYIMDNGINFSIIDSGDLNQEKLSSVIGTVASNQQEILVEIPMWVGMSLSENRTLMIKNKINFFYGDLFYIFLVVIVVLIMCIPTLFLFIIVITNSISQSRIEKLLHSDPLTEGNSWRYFEQYSCKTLTSLKNANKLFAIVDVSLLKYGNYCTFHGVKAGENLLRNIDEKLSHFTKNDECDARYGKATFALLLKCESREECEKRVTELIDDMSKTLGHSGCIIFHSGIYFIEPETNEKGRTVRRKPRDIDEYYNCATNARAAITDENHSGVITFDQKLRDEQIWEHKVEERMQAALDNEEFKVYLQPKYNPVTEELSGAEALVRWINDEDGFVPPGRFIPLFEKNGFITKLDDYMISHVAKFQAAWLEQGKDLVPVSVNVSRAHFADPNLAEHICSLIDEHKVPHHLIEIELTESAFFDDKAALLSTVHKLKDFGFAISMDDFGAGYSSLNSLKDLPLDVLKLDAEFFRGENDGDRGEIVVSQAIQLAKELNMRIVAEGVEKKDQVDFLAAHDCDMIQGFYFAKPMPAEEYEGRLKDSVEKK